MTFWDGNRWLPEAPPTRGGPRPHRRALSALAEASLITLLMFGLIVGTALAAKPTSSVWVVELAAHSLDARDTLQLGDHFTVGYETKEREPWALATCYPNASSDYLGTHPDGSMWSAIFSLWSGGPTPQNFVLGDSVYPLWTGGGADCTVTLLTYSPDLSRRSVLATAGFSVAP